MDDEHINIGTPADRKLGKVDTSFYIIAIGASAGGLDAIKRFLSSLPQSFPHSLVIVQHISPDYKSMMPDILSRETWLPVLEVDDDMKVESGKIYLIPPKANIVIQGTPTDVAEHSAGPRPVERTSPEQPAPQGLRFSLTTQVRKPALNLPIDLFFTSLAEAVGNRSIAVVLSGTGSDGSRGIRTVKDHDGFILVQDPGLAGFDGMPRTAIATGLVDKVLPAEDMLPEIERYIDLRDKGVIEPEDGVSLSPEFHSILKLVSADAEIDFTSYKTPTLMRRIVRRMALRGHIDAKAYLQELKTNAQEANALSREFLVGVTNFFRDLPVWMAFRERVLKKLFEEGAEDTPVRVWVAACSTGEEAYTLSMLMEDYRSTHGLKRDFRIYATDANESAITMAKQGLFSTSLLDEIPEEFREKGFLDATPDGFRISPHIRTRVVFSVHNVVEDPPFTRIDLITCRNLLIYLSPDVQARVITQFSFSLRKAGFLVLGAAETPGNHGTMFKPVVPKMRIYENQRIPSSTRESISKLMEYSLPSGMRMPRARRLNLQDRMPDEELQKLIYFALEEAETAICLVDENARMIRSFGDVKTLLRFPEDGYSPYLLELVDERLRSSIMLIIRRAQSEHVSKRPGLRLIDKDVIRKVDITARRVEWGTHGLVYAVSFHFVEEPPPRPVLAGQDTIDMPHDAYIEHLENEVQALQDMLSATAEDLGASNEELQTANEELSAANEELQATNEETQSINEELHTVNTEHQERIVELEAAYSDIENLMATAEIGVLVLSANMRVRRFSAGLGAFVNIDGSMLGQPLDNLSTVLSLDSIANLRDDARLALEAAEESARELSRMDGGWLRVRTRPYYNSEGEVVGSVITMRDITDVKLLEHDLKYHRERLDVMLESELAGYFDWTPDTGKSYLSPRLKNALGYGELEIPDNIQGWSRLIAPEDRETARAAVAAHLHGMERDAVLSLDLQLLHREGHKIWFQVRGRVISRDASGRADRVSGVLFDIATIKGREFELIERDDGARRRALTGAMDLAATVKHLTSAQGALLGNGSTPQSALDKIDAVLTNMQEQIGEVLGTLSLPPNTLASVDTPLSDILKAVMRRLEHGFVQAGIDFRFGPLVTVNVIPEALTEVLIGLFEALLMNASTSQARRIEIGSEKVEANPGRVIIQIRDTAAPTDDAFYDPLRSPADAATVLLHGTPDGLAMCRRMIDLMNADISVSHDQGASGVVLQLTLPSGE